MYHFLHYLARYRGWLFTVCLLFFYHLIFRGRVIPSTRHGELNVESTEQNYPYLQHASPSTVFSSLNNVVLVSEL